MKFKRIIFSFLLIFIMLIPSACSKQSDTKIVLITGENGKNGSYTDKAAYETLSAISKEKKFDLEIVEPSTIQNYDKKFIEIMSDAPDIVVYSNPSSETKAVISARNYPDTYFLLVGASADINLDGMQDVNNIYGITFSKTQAGFLSGIYAASHAQNNICFIGGREYLSMVEYEASFCAGVKCISPDKAVKVIYLGDGQTNEAVTSRLNSEINDDCDIIYTVNASEAIYDFAKQKGITVIGAEYDYSSDYAYKMSFVVKNDVSSAVTRAINDYFEGTFQGQIKIFGFENAGLSPVFTDPKDTSKELVEKWEKRIAEKTFTIPSTRNETSIFVVPQFD